MIAISKMAPVFAGAFLRPFLINAFSVIFDFTLPLFCVYYKRIQKS